MCVCACVCTCVCACVCACLMCFGLYVYVCMFMSVLYMFTQSSLVFVCVCACVCIGVCVWGVWVHMCVGSPPGEGCPGPNPRESVGFPVFPWTRTFSLQKIHGLGAGGKRRGWSLIRFKVSYGQGLRAGQLRAEPQYHVPTHKASPTIQRLSPKLQRLALCSDA